MTRAGRRAPSSLIVARFPGPISGAAYEMERANGSGPQKCGQVQATSHLDTANETAINAAVRAMQLTRIVIAHRPQMTASAQRVFRLEHGRIQAITDADPHWGGDAGAIGTACQ